MIDVVNWRDWLKPYEREPAFPFIAGAVEAAIASEKFSAVWISGSRATRTTDQHSDIDIRAHAPSWAPADFRTWLNQVDPQRNALVRLSWLSPTHWNYECLLAGTVPVDLLVISGETPMISFDSVVFKTAAPLKMQASLQVIKDVGIGLDDLRNLMDGVVIDQQKFAKLLGRNDRFSALLLLDAQRFALLRLGYIAAGGTDCGPRGQHTLASLKLVRETISQKAPASVVAAVAGLVSERTIEENMKTISAAAEKIFAALLERFPALSAPRS